MVVFLAALAGAIVGGLITWLFSLWRTVVEGQAAARVIRLEITGNVTELELASDGNWHGLDLSDDAWRQHRLALAPILNEKEIGLLYRDQLHITHIRRLVEAPLGTPGVAQTLADWNDDLRERRRDLRRIESRSRWALVFRVLFCRWVSSAEELSEAFLPRGTQEEGP